MASGKWLIASGKWLVTASVFLILASCAGSPKPEVEVSAAAQDSVKTVEVPKFNMAAELAKLDTMLVADSPSVATAHESYLRALDMLEAERIIFAELFYKRALANDPESHFLLNELIKILLKQNKTGEAFPLLKLAVQSPKATGDNFLYMARLYREKGNLDSSEVYYKKATDKMPDNFNALYEYSLLLDSLRDREFNRKSEVLSAEFRRICVELKRVYDILLPELDYTKKFLDKQLILYGVTNTPDSTVANLLGEAFKANGAAYIEYGYLQAEILSSMKKYEEANEILSVIYFMNHSKELTSASALKIANNYEHMNRIAEAVIWLEQLLKQSPEDHIAMNNLGYMLIDHDIDLSKGIALVDKALVYSPEERSYLDSKAWGFYKKGKYQEALEILEKLEAAGMDDNELWLHLAKICEALELHERAKKYMEKIRN
ncbi:MAG: hypothetical protein FWC26_04730 [Fibromonadales bacterium]|nr:hypothetical protein [Fibromonadales bacterium]